MEYDYLWFETYLHFITSFVLCHSCHVPGHLKFLLISSVNFFISYVTSFSVFFLLNFGSDQCTLTLFCATITKMKSFRIRIICKFQPTYATTTMDNTENVTQNTYVWHSVWSSNFSVTDIHTKTRIIKYEPFVNYMHLFYKCMYFKK